MDGRRRDGLRWLRRSRRSRSPSRRCRLLRRCGWSGRMHRRRRLSALHCRGRTAAVQAQQVDDPARQREGRRTPRCHRALILRGSGRSRRPSRCRKQMILRRSRRRRRTTRRRRLTLLRGPGAYRGAPAQRAGVLARAVKWVGDPARRCRGYRPLGEGPRRSFAGAAAGGFRGADPVSHRLNRLGEKNGHCSAPARPALAHSSFRGAPWAT